MNIDRLLGKEETGDKPTGVDQLYKTLGKMKRHLIESGIVVLNPTHLTQFDATTSQILRGENNILMVNYGIPGRLCGISGMSEVGKTAYAIQLGVNTVGDYPSAIMHYMDMENNTSISRIHTLSGWDDDQLKRKVVFSPGSIYTNLALDMIRAHCDTKRNNPKDYLINTGLLDIDGSEMKRYIPTFIAIDSLSNIATNDGDANATVEDFNKDKSGDFVETDTLIKNTDAMRRNKELKIFFEKMKPYLNKYNIILVVVVHKGKDMILKMFDFGEKHHANLKPGEKYKANKDFILQCSLLFELFPGERIGPKEKDKRNQPIYGDDIHGMIIKNQIIKNKTNTNLTSHSSVNTSNRGCIAELTDLECLIDTKDENGIIYGIGGSQYGYYLEIYPYDLIDNKNMKFKKANAYDKLCEDMLFLQAVKFTAFVRFLYERALKSYVQAWTTIKIQACDYLPDMGGLYKILDDELRVSMMFLFADQYSSMNKHLRRSNNKKLFQEKLLPMIQKGKERWLKIYPDSALDSSFASPILPADLIMFSHMVNDLEKYPEMKDFKYEPGVTVIKDRSLIIDELSKRTAS